VNSEEISMFLAAIK